eukprot:UN11272
MSHCLIDNKPSSNLQQTNIYLLCSIIQENTAPAIISN